jgi:F420-dependent hydroxymycolic acid dehydrogenase
VGFVLSHEQFPQLVDQAHAAEQAGFRYLWASDHIQPWQDNEGYSMFPWLTLALVGQRTKHVPFGTGVTCRFYRCHPTVAHAFASLAVPCPGGFSSVWEPANGSTSRPPPHSSGSTTNATTV